MKFTCIVFNKLNTLMFIDVESMLLYSPIRANNLFYTQLLFMAFIPGFLIESENVWKIIKG